MVQFKIAAACLALTSGAFPLGAAEQVGSPLGIDVIRPVEGLPWSGDRMLGARDRLKDVLPGSPG